MMVKPAVRWSMLAGVSLVTAVVLGVSIVAGSAPNDYPIGSAPDSTTVDRLTRSQFNSAYPPLAPSITITETAAVLAAEWLVGDYDFQVDLPLVAR
ncbi:MAG: hypothetical protein HGB05_09735 [Chloroflexi bacterium]|nr:hypothetical protein [Chloroflexota bacterium]